MRLRYRAALTQSRVRSRAGSSYDKDGKAVATTAGKPYEKKPYKKNGGGSDKQMAYLTTTIKSLVKKGIKKAGKKKPKKRSYESSTSDFDSE